MLNTLKKIQPVVGARHFTTSDSWSQELINSLYRVRLSPTNPLTLKLLKKNSAYANTRLLHYIVQRPYESPESVRVLLKAGAQVNKPDATGKTALHYLALTTNLTMNEEFPSKALGYFKKYKANFTKKDKNKKIPADYATETMCKKFTKY